VTARPSDPGAVWARVCGTLRGRVGERNFASWIAPLRSRWIDGALALEAPDRATRDRVARHFLGEIEKALAEAVGRGQAVRLALAAPSSALPIPVRPPSPDHTFETFVLGESNGRACALARALVEDESRAPLFVHGRSGVGKTHLLHAVFHALEAAGVIAACLSAAQLVAALVGAYEAHADERFWADLSGLGALLLDDAHSIKGLEEIQECLMAGLAAWVEGGRLLVLTCDRAPSEMSAFVGRLQARFAGSLVASIEPPEPALRIAILQNKARARGVTLDPPLAARVAIDVGGNVRRLEGALTRLVAHARLSGRRIDEALAMEVLPALRPRVPVALTVDRILAATAEVFGTSARRLRARRRDRELALPRQVAMYLARKLLASPFAELATAFGRDHTTLLHASRSVALRLGTDAALAARIAQIEQRLRPAEEP
jgi:chromosomal replication initiator protein